MMFWDRVTIQLQEQQYEQDVKTLKWSVCVIGHMIGQSLAMISS